MIIAVAQLNYHIGNFEENTRTIIQYIAQAKEQHADLIVFAEMAVGGYSAKDMYRYNAFLDACEESLQHIALACDTIACIIGAPVKHVLPPAKKLHNAAIFIADQKIQRAVYKSLLPDYDVFDENRYFQPNSFFDCIEFKQQKIALTICEDLWNEVENLYSVDPLAELAKADPDFIINIAASPFSVEHYHTRIKLLQTKSARYGLPLVYVNQLGANADVIFDGRSLIIDQKNVFVDTLNAFDEEMKYYDIRKDKIVALQPLNSYKEEKGAMAEIHQALLLGIKDFFRKSGFKSALVGLSGGIDSAVVAELACEALGAENVYCVLLPSVYSSDHSIQDAIDLVNNVGCHHEVVPIKSTVAAIEASLSDVFNGKEQDVTEENIQARARAVILMAISNKFGHILLNTSNKSESAVGYGTLYGDMAGALSVIGDLLKTKVYNLAAYINRNKEIIPTNTLTKAPSAELRPGQKDADSLPAYAVLDAILVEYVEQEKSAKEIIALGFEEATVLRIIQLVNRAEYKRFQSPPILRISRKAFGAGRTMPLVAITSI